MTTKPTPIDPVCGKRIDPSRKPLRREFKGTLYYFCQSDCRDLFAAEPERYLDAEKPPRRGFWRRYLDRIDKATGGKPPCCH